MVPMKTSRLICQFMKCEYLFQFCIIHNSINHSSFLFRPAQVVKIVVLCAVLFTFSLQMYVCIEIVQNAVKSRVSKSCASTANYIIRFVVVL